MVKQEFSLREAHEIANRYVKLLSPSCERIEIAGSIRRKKQTVGDIEIVAIPKISKHYDLFGNIHDGESLLDAAIIANIMMGGGILIKGGERYKQFALAEGVTLDLFIVRPPAQWGVIFAIRTGGKNFSRHLVTKRMYGGLLPNDCKVRDGAVWRDDKIIPMPEEHDFLMFLGIENVPPEDR